MSLLKRIIFWALIVVLILVIVYRTEVIQNQLIFRPSKEMIDANLPVHQELAFTSGRNRLVGWFFPNTNNKRVIIVFHGNAGNISHRSTLINFLLRLPSNLFIFDYSGYGLSTGTPNELTVYRDGEMAYQKMVSLGYQEIILFGESLGGAVAIWVATRQQEPHRLILQSTFSSVKTLVPPYLRPFVNHFPSLSRINQVKCPIFFAHSQADEIIPFKHSQMLYQQFTGPKRFYEIQGGHNTPVLDHQYSETLSDFIS